MCVWSWVSWCVAPGDALYARGLFVWSLSGSAHGLLWLPRGAAEGIVSRGYRAIKRVIRQLVALARQPGESTAFLTGSIIMRPKPARGG